MNDSELLASIKADERYQRNLDWGKPRRGHPEGSIRAHIEELEANLKCLASQFSEDQITKLQILIHTHDTFKPNAREGNSIRHPESHASLARSFLAEFCDDQDLLNMVQFHDEPYALWKRHVSGRHNHSGRFSHLLETIEDWDLFNAFLIIDGYTDGKSRAPLRWWFASIQPFLKSSWQGLDLSKLPSQEMHPGHDSQTDRDHH